MIWGLCGPVWGSSLFGEPFFCSCPAPEWSLRYNVSSFSWTRGTCTPLVARSVAGRVGGTCSRWTREKQRHTCGSDAGNHCDQSHLRTYWYDAAPDAVPTEEQLEFGAQRGVKLRLGRLTQSGQKGVDSRIVRDLIVLPRNGAVSTIYLMSGDEDVREGVVEAQELGVSVVLLGIEPPAGRYNQAATLIREADDLITLSRSDCEHFLSLRSTIGRAAQPLRKPVEIELPQNASGEDFGRLYGAECRARLTPDAAAKVMEDRPRIPRTFDADLLKAAVGQLGDLDDQDRRAIRRGFWVGFEAAEIPIET